MVFESIPFGRTAGQNAMGFEVAFCNAVAIDLADVRRLVYVSGQLAFDEQNELDMVLVMTVEPGFGGQAFLDVTLPKIRRTRKLIERHGLSLWLQVDGGVSAATIERCAEAGADVFVAGSAVYGADDPAAAVAALREQAERAGRPASHTTSG